MCICPRESQQLERAIAESFCANRDLELSLMEEFTYVDAEADGAL